MSTERVLIGQTMLDLSAVASCHWEGDRLFVYLASGRFLIFTGVQAKALYSVLSRDVPELVERTGMVQE